MWLTAKKKKKLDPYSNPQKSVYPSKPPEHNVNNRGKDQGGQLFDVERTQPNTTDFGELRHQDDNASQNVDRSFGERNVDYDPVRGVDVGSEQHWASLKNLMKWLKK